MQKHSVGIVGASGYSGMEATRILARHPAARLRFLTSDRWVGEPAEKRLGPLGPLSQLAYAPQDEAEALSAECEVVLLATPADVSFELAPKILAAGAKAIDLSGAHRLTDRAEAKRWYGLAHPEAGLLDEAVFGLTELYRAEVAGARLVANPGCYPTSAILPLAPLLRRGLVEPDSIVIHSASGVTGAGRKIAEEFGFVEIEGDFRAYRVMRHQHTPEIAQTLSRLAREEVRPLFTPHLLPVKRGILTTIAARLRASWGAAAVAAALGDAFRAEPFVALAASPDEVSLKQVVGTNLCRIGFAVDGDRVILVSAIDNLVKGAAGQAVQNMNLVMGLEETAGLTGLRPFFP